MQLNAGQVRLASHPARTLPNRSHQVLYNEGDDSDSFYIVISTLLAAALHCTLD